MTKILLFDWGNTIMVDFNLPGPMYTWNKAAWVPGAEDALKALDEHVCCIATNAGESNAEAVKKGLAMVGADTYFKFIFSSWDIGFEKPDPRFFRFITDTLVTSADNCIMIGDNYQKDIAGAKSAGMKTILLDPTGHNKPCPLADAVIRSMNGLPDTIRKI
jgi:putative hydrolase of the HAD superfamily